MKRQSIVQLIAAAVVAVAAPALMGSTITLRLDSVNYTAPPGGEYNAQVTGVLGGKTLGQILAGYDALATAVEGGVTGFQTFCTDETEHFTPGKAYQAVINDRVVIGGANLYHPTVTPGADILSVGTTWLYSQFANGVLSGYNYTFGAGRVASASDLQEAIWGLEDEIPLNLANPFVAAAAGFFADPQVDAAAGSYGVYAVNLTTKGGDPRQDVLIYLTPDGGMTLALLGFGLATIWVFGLRAKST